MKSLKKATGWIIAGVAALLIIVAATSATTIVPAGHAGVVVTMGSVSNRVLDEGLHFKMPFVQQVVMMNNKIQKTEVASNSVSKDLQTISSSVAINFHITKDASATIYQTIGEQYSDTVLQPAIQEAVKAVTAQYTAEELITKRSAVGDEIGQTLSEKVSDYGILIDKFNIVDFDFSEEFNAAIEQKQVAEQNKLRAETEKEQQIIEAEAAAKQKTIAADADAEATLKNNGPNVYRNQYPDCRQAESLNYLVRYARPTLQPSPHTTWHIYQWRKEDNDKKIDSFHYKIDVRKRAERK